MRGEPTHHAVAVAPVTERLARAGDSQQVALELSEAHGSISTPGFSRPSGSTACLAARSAVGEQIGSLAVVLRAVHAADGVVVGDRAAGVEHRLARGRA